MNKTDKLDQLEQRLGHKFENREYLIRALTHSSTGDGNRKVRDNQRFEFLGDRVLGLLTAEALVNTYKGYDEGELAPRLNAVVRKEACARAGRRMDLGPAMTMSHGEAKRGGRENESIIADASEAIMAAVYLDGGLAAARDVFERFWGEELEELDDRPQDPKSALQERAAARRLPVPHYHIADRNGPEHRPIFTAKVQIKGVGEALGEGGSKRDAERAAAAILLAQLGGDDTND